ncbi:uncharacterized protein PpBr36_05700 [Pyricularia pennisetigena]|uniref:uncharacterized protein n=1 Tax=Pyricularia pennisetigena TaxID=1578925 RepID=UPI001154EC1E|nr:uncharacterized protein PpBr36_05700 [Pyricularia pennisetigena]TLS23266.1 hypothetical protein PpBr36_05700 [Pyricularia pennisetigena]
MTATKASSTFTHRSSLACTACRDRHVRCDGIRPHCSRCSYEARHCEYTPSRRGGLTRAELAARRASKEQGGSTTGVRSHDGAGRQPRRRSGATAVFAATASPSPPLSASGTVPAGTPDPLVDLYYRHFHRRHPFLLPQRYMADSLGSRARRDEYEPLLASMRFIGSLYAKSDQAAELGESVRLAIHARGDLHPDPALAQCRLLYSIASYWCGDRDAARREIDAALGIAIGLGMHRREFAVEHSGPGDPVLAESMRRTWWSIYVVDAWYAGIGKRAAFATRGVHITADLPCEEREYKSGTIPTPKTLDEFDSREFSPDNHVYSSFAYLIGATRGIASALASVPADAEHTFPTPEIIYSVDAIVEGWDMLLPDCKRDVLTASGELDELMFQAFMSVHAWTIGLHRPYSSLHFNALEAHSSCPQPMTTMTDSAAATQTPNNIHTTRCLRSIQAQVRLLALPARPFCHTPFAICMMTAGTITLLSACKHLPPTPQDASPAAAAAAYDGLSLSRHQVRLGMGCLMAMAHVWPQGRRHLAEVQAIAREVLGIGGGGGGGGVGCASAAATTTAAAGSPVATPRGGVGEAVEGEQQQQCRDSVDLSGFSFVPDGTFDGLLDLNGTLPTDSFWCSAFFSSERGLAG